MTPAQKDVAALLLDSAVEFEGHDPQAGMTRNQAAADLCREIAAALAAPQAAEARKPVGYAIYGYGRIQRLIVNEDAANEYADQMQRNAREAGYRDCNATVTPLFAHGIGSQP
jgi:hypothetical protein